MMKRFVFVLSLAVVFVSCDKREKEKLALRVDSLNNELMISQEAARTLQEVGTLLDSVDASRQLLRTNMVEGTSYEEYISRMHDVNDYVKETQRKIAELEKAARSSKSANASYASTIKKLKNDLEKTSKEMVALQELVAKYRSENDNLVITVSQRDAEIAEKTELIRVKEQELTTIDTQFKEFSAQTKLNEADAYFKHAQAVEETANRTKFAPKKKKRTRQEALELYKMALFLGKEEAQPKIAALEKKL
jgi:chromosome segregation ATPase